jgi:maltose alpha-D-glucosyltransferase/alpha-amylase
MMFKLYRRVASGIHPEVEMTRFLTEVARFPNTPPLLGAIEVVDSAGHPTALGVAHAQVRNQGDGWTYTLDYLKRFLDEAALHPETLAQPGADPHAVYITLARTLGARTAEMHRALASDDRDPAFRPEPTGPRDLVAWRRRVDADARAAISALKQVRNSLPKTASEPVERLLSLKKEALDRLAGLVPDHTSAMRTRFHGDLHLGQVIVVQNDFHIIDFEGEPARPLSERRYKSSPLRDVAGMLRSFSYAAWSALLDNAKIRAETFDGLLPRVQDWESRTAAAFLGGYRETIGDCPSYPSQRVEADRLTQFFTFEKAFYEISYEAANRPGWLHIPVLGVLRLINAGVELP